MQMSLTVEERLDRIEQLLRGQKNVLNFSEACDFTGISPSYMYKLTHNARIPHYKPHGRMSTSCARSSIIPKSCTAVSSIFCTSA